jgi:HD-like signal output (HDOD) protein
MASAWQDGQQSKGHGAPSSTLSETVVDEIPMTTRDAVLTEACGDEAIRAHCLRVATWSSELAGAIGLSESDRNLVEQAAIAHHVPEILVDDQARRRLLAEMHLETEGERPFISDDVQAVLETLWGRRPIVDAIMGKIVAVLEISDDFDQFFESEPLFDADSSDQCTNSSVEAMMTYLQVTSRADVSRVIDRLPVFPRATREVVRLVANPDVGPAEMEAVASLDPVLAGRLIQTANSAYYSPRLPIGTVIQAVSYIGTETARRVLLAAALRGNFSCQQAHQLWNHSLDVAQTAFAIMPVAFQERFQRLTDGGCPPIEVEMCLSGRSHGEVGAETLAQWKFPAEIIEAVRWHHRPERCTQPLSSLLYLAEFITESQEDLPSYVRMNTATQLAGISMPALAEIRQKNPSSLESLRFAA